MEGKGENKEPDDSNLRAATGRRDDDGIETSRSSRGPSRILRVKAIVPVTAGYAMQNRPRCNTWDTFTVVKTLSLFYLFIYLPFCSGMKIEGSLLRLDHQLMQPNRLILLVQIYLSRLLYWKFWISNFEYKFLLTEYKLI